LFFGRKLLLNYKEKINPSENYRDRGNSHLAVGFLVSEPSFSISKASEEVPVKSAKFGRNRCNSGGN
jgi:hypothetical protein